MGGSAENGLRCQHRCADCRCWCYGRVAVGSRLSEPLPKARRGGKIEGARHEQGGVLVETEGEERIVAARPAKAFPNCLTSFHISARTQVCPIPATHYVEQKPSVRQQVAVALPLRLTTTGWVRWSPSV